MNLDIVIKGGRVFDGTGSEPFQSEIGIKGDAIVSIGSRIGVSGAKKVIDASGLSVSPGFIDTHAHSDFTLLADPRAQGKVSQGVTTEINGNCGLSGAPLLGEAFEQRQADLKELRIKERWNSIEEYLYILEDRGLSINFATLIGHGNLRASIIGYKNKTPDAKEMDAMKHLLMDSLKAGAIGMSTGLIYPPGVYSDTPELIELSRSLQLHVRRGSQPPYTSHMRSEGDRLLEAIAEVISIGKASKARVHISHIKTSGKRNWHKIEKAISLIEDAKGKGIRLTCDRYPYTAASTDLDSILPSWALEGGNRAVLRRLKEANILKRIKSELVSSIKDSSYWKTVVVSSTSTGGGKWMEGKSIEEIAKTLKNPPIDALFEILIREKLRAGGIFHSMNEGNLKRFLNLPYCMIGSDSSARSFDGPTHKGKPHPRGFGTFPRFLSRYAGQKGLMSMGEAIHRMTMLPAKTFGLSKRGRIKRGFKADIVIFDEKKIKDNATFDEPFKTASGIHYVIVNGVPVLYDGKMTGMRPGRVLRHGG